MDPDDELIGLGEAHRIIWEQRGLDHRAWAKAVTDGDVPAYRSDTGHIVVRRRDAETWCPTSVT